MAKVILDEDLGANKAGDELELDDDKAQALIDAGCAHAQKDEDEETLSEDEDMNAEEKDENEDEDKEDVDSAKLTRSIEDNIIRKVTAEISKSLAKSPVKRPNMNINPNAHVNYKEDGTGGFKSLGHFLKDVAGIEYGDFESQSRVNKYKKTLRTKNIPGLETKDMSTTVSSAGGLFIPQTWSDEIYRLTFKDVPNLLELMTKYEFQNKTLHIPSAQQASGTSAVQAYWQTEGTAVNESDAVSAELQLTMNTLIAFINVSQQTLDFSSPYNLAQFFNAYAPERIRYKVNDAVVNGGNGQANLIGNAASVAVTRAAANHITLPDINKMWIAMHESFRSDAVWLVESAAQSELFALAFPGSGGTTPAFLPVGANWTGGTGNMAYPPLGMIFGKPVYAVENLSALGTEGDFICVNLKSHAAGFRDLGGSSTPFLHYDKFQESFRWVLYCASGNPLLLPYTRKNGSTCSNCVVLD